MRAQRSGWEGKHCGVAELCAAVCQERGATIASCRVSAGPRECALSLDHGAFQGKGLVCEVVAQTMVRSPEEANEQRPLDPYRYGV